MGIGGMLGLGLVFVGTFLFSSLVEYWLHRLMHVRPDKCQFHVDHHAENTGQGVFKEFLEYMKVVVPIPLILLLFSWKVSLAFFLGAVTYAIFSAYAHQLQHDNPTKCFWMPMPVHYVHHTYGQWHHNFGLGVDWWDRIFGTYKPTDWETSIDPTEPERSALQVRWW
ncbi:MULTISPECIES: sterol desaturase family protein [unclassified Leptolyngbya]|uniref:sterol desaturase family protein n=1 Tax=unclassified Leptolyngbya TaxID=2650499 RepID=UPI001A7F077F|nr:MULTISPECIES: sterol desaturase family protein [unclassified Leptolyngbya]